jgi:hypothetical protein
MFGMKRTDKEVKIGSQRGQHENTFTSVKSRRHLIPFVVMTVFNDVDVRS